MGVSNTDCIGWSSRNTGSSRRLVFVPPSKDFVWCHLRSSMLSEANERFGAGSATAELSWSNTGDTGVTGAGDAV